MALPKADLAESDVHAIRALLRFEASPDEQMRAMTAILSKMCRRGDSPMLSEGPDRDIFAMIGRHQIGVMITACNTEERLLEAIAADASKVRKPPPKRGTRHDPKS